MVTVTHFFFNTFVNVISSYTTKTDEHGQHMIPVVTQITHVCIYMSASYWDVIFIVNEKIIAGTYRCSPITAFNFYIGCDTDVDFTTSSGTSSGSDTWPAKIRDARRTRIIFWFGVNSASTDVDDPTASRSITTTYSCRTALTVCLDISPSDGDIFDSSLITRADGRSRVNISIRWTGVKKYSLVVNRKKWAIL